MNSAILITGTSTGIGRATALRLASGGATVFAGVRESSDGDSLRAEASGDVRPLRLDVTKADEIASATALVDEAVGARGLDGLVNNAGIPVPGPLELLPIDDFREQLEVNLIGQLAVTQAFLPLLRRGEGRVVFVSSVGGRAAFPYAGAYHASKFGLEAVGEVLRQELGGSGVDVVLVEPGPAQSEIWSRARARLHEVINRAPADRVDPYRDSLAEFERTLIQQDEDGMDADDVAAEIKRALEADHPSARYPVGLPAKVLAALRPLIPDRLFDLAARRPYARR
jgi:NAD(P)-dependent dehydrogenase (short-subunit alcohol dehydrogenase family)